MIVNSRRKFWKRRFAFLPIVLNNGPERTLVWLEWVWVRDGGMCTEVSLFDPADPLPPSPSDDREAFNG